MSLAVLNAEGVTHGRAALAPALAEQAIKPHLIHETVVAELAWRRSGTHSTKTRSDVRGGGRKPWRQKGTGRARQGSIRAPQWVGGGIVFGPTPRSHGGKVNRKVRAQAFRATLRAHAERGSVAIMDPTAWDTPSTKRAAEYLRQTPDGLQVRPLAVVLADADGVEARSFRNIEGVVVLPAVGLETADLLQFRAVLVERSVWEELAGAPCDVEDVTPEPRPPVKKKRKSSGTRKKAAPKKRATAPAEEAEAGADADEPAEEAEAAPEPAEEPVAEAAEPDASEDDDSGESGEEPAEDGADDAEEANA